MGGDDKVGAVSGAQRLEQTSFDDQLFVLECLDALLFSNSSKPFSAGWLSSAAVYC